MLRFNNWSKLRQAHQQEPQLTEIPLVQEVISDHNMPDPSSGSLGAGCTYKLEIVEHPLGGRNFGLKDKVNTSRAAKFTLQNLFLQCTDFLLGGMIHRRHHFEGQRF